MPLNKIKEGDVLNLLYQIPEYQTNDLLQGCLMHHKKKFTVKGD